MKEIFYTNILTLDLCSTRLIELFTLWQMNDQHTLRKIPDIMLILFVAAIILATKSLGLSTGTILYQRFYMQPQKEDGLRSDQRAN